uniref:Uncharacterized protein n=2 Tax=Oryza nivara TaxID=4536 RepID=A0A0E0IPI4_ORYNI
MEAAVFAPHQVAILALPAVEAEAAAAAAPGGWLSISKGGAVMRRYTHGPWRTGVCGGCGQGGNHAAGQGKIPSLSVNLDLLMRLLLRRGRMDQKLWLANWHIAQEHNLRRDRVRSWLSDDFLKSLQHQFACSRPIIIAKISELEVWRCSYSGWKFIWSRLITLLLAINQSPMVNVGTHVHTSYRHRGHCRKKKRSRFQIVFLVPKCRPRSCYAAPPTVQVWILSMAEDVRRWEMDLLPPPSA